MLHVEVEGKGPDLVLVHGWGMHGGLWSDWAQQLSRWFRVHRVDLPGHGYSRYQGEGSLDRWASAVVDATPAKAWWLGWSLGGLVALAAAARDEHHIRGLVLLATNPKFVTSASWRPAVDPAVFEEFVQQLEADTERTLARFVSLQVRHADRGGETLRRLRGKLKDRQQPNPEALRAGLRFLQEGDMRTVLNEMELPLFWLLGERDTLVPAAVLKEFQGVQSAVIDGAGHAPFLSHPQQCGDWLRRWLLADGQGERHAAG